MHDTYIKIEKGQVRVILPVSPWAVSKQVFASWPRTPSLKNPTESCAERVL